MVFQVHMPPLSGVANLSTVLFLVCLLFSFSHSKPCRCTRSDRDLLGNHTISHAFDQLPGSLQFLTSRSSSTCGLPYRETVFGGLASYMQTYHPKFDSSQKVCFFSKYLWDALGNGERSFSIVFTMMTIDQLENQKDTSSNIVFTIAPAEDIREICHYDLAFDPPISRRGTSTIDGRNVTVKISTETSMLVVKIHIDLQGNSSVASKYIRVWIDYDNPYNASLSLFVDSGEGTQKPANAVVSTNIFTPIYTIYQASFGFISSMGQLLQLHTFNSTISSIDDRLLLYCPVVVEARGYPFSAGPDSQGKQTIILASLGSAAATAITAAVVYFYFNSKYRRWKLEQEKLTKTMHRLPGVPTHVDYAVIRRATRNFHETMRLGKGGFGAVFRCTLPATASRTGSIQEVAVKKFLREVEDRRYNDFMAEVSIINRLRHKNIVPLVGWSYNKGEPLLLYEYMSNGSLDQHLFRRGGTTRKQQQEDGSTGQWQTRYNIARDIATGLHYVHHEHEPMVLHRDIKASNIMLDMAFRARLGDFGIASTVTVDRSSVTGIAGTWGYIAPEYAITYRSTRQTDIYAFGVLILEVVTGKKNGDVSPEDDHITDWVWRLHQEGKLLEAVDSAVLPAGVGQHDNIFDGANRLLLLGLACTIPNPSNRPSMAEVVQVITKLAPPPDVPLVRPSFMWPPVDWRSRNSVYSTAVSDWDRSQASTLEPVHLSQDQQTSAAAGGNGSVDTTASASESLGGIAKCSLSEEIQSRV